MGVGGGGGRDLPEGEDLEVGGGGGEGLGEGGVGLGFNAGLGGEPPPPPHLDLLQSNGLAASDAHSLADLCPLLLGTQFSRPSNTVEPPNLLHCGASLVK